MTKSLGHTIATSKFGCCPEIKWSTEWKNVCPRPSVITGAVLDFSSEFENSLSLIAEKWPGVLRPDYVPFRVITPYELMEPITRSCINSLKLTNSWGLEKQTPKRDIIKFMRLFWNSIRHMTIWLILKLFAYEMWVTSQKVSNLTFK